MRIAHTVLHAGLCDLVEGNTVVVVHIELEHLRYMPRNGFTLAVRVGSEVDFSALLGAFLEFLDNVLLALHICILRLEVVILVYAHLGLGQISDVSHRSDDFVPGTEVFLYCFSLCRRLYYY